MAGALGGGAPAFVVTLRGGDVGVAEKLLLIQSGSAFSRGGAAPLEELVAAMDGRDAMLEEKASLALLGLEEDAVGIEADDDASDPFAVDLHHFHGLLGLEKPRSASGRRSPRER